MRGSLWVVGLIALAAVALLFVLQGFEPRPLTAAEAQAEPPRYELRDIEWVRLDEKGQTVLRAVAESGQYFDDKSARLENVEIDRLGGRNGAWHLSAPHGDVAANESRINLNAPVTASGEIRAGEPVKLTTRQLWVDWQRRELYTDGAVAVRGRTLQVRARGLRADWAGTRVQLLHKVQVEYVVPPR